MENFNDIIEKEINKYCKEHNYTNSVEDGYYDIAYHFANLGKELALKKLIEECHKRKSIKNEQKQKCQEFDKNACKRF